MFFDGMIVAWGRKNGPFEVGLIVLLRRTIALNPLKFVARIPGAIADPIPVLGSISGWFSLARPLPYLTFDLCSSIFCEQSLSVLRPLALIFYRLG